MTSELFSPLSLRSGQVLGNRIAKAAMEENMAAGGQLPDKELFGLYRRWAAGGTGLLITGNVMVHAEALTGPAGVVLDAAAPLEPFVEWARAGKSGGGSIWMQINHPGRQIGSDMPGVVWGPSAVAVDLGRHSSRFGRPVAMTPEQIRATVTRYAVTARRAEEAGFDGVEVHAAHGYLLSQFLSPWSTSAPTSGAARWRTGPGCCWTSSAPSVPPSPRPSPSRSSSTPPTSSAAASTPTTHAR